MKATCYLRIAKGPRGFKFIATSKPSADPIKTGSYADALPTRQIKLQLELPPGFFGPDATVDVEVPEGAGEILVEVEAPEHEPEEAPVA
jgi:hypothetical protein